ncbi:TonB-dependent receptor [Altererythrobacter xixiisoli]|uniref:TonB-dependent receptor n=1 Tax=Croceibacterium xixiisoli TaxID=1476466 RepID=A0A6I4U0V9_9SPHN|nr:TonB-dependent receptor [Croceibacterium xixiisoli]MXP00598.1 TonB-dependent receptor [Croceibacterium xixiisoli]
MSRQLFTGASLAALAMLLPAAAHAQDGSRDSATEEEGEEILVRAEPLPGGLLEDKGRLGILGDQSVMQIPYSLQSMTSKQLELFNNPSLPLANVLQNNPSIRSSTSSPMYSDFSMRGVNMNGNHMMLNGVPSMFSQFTTPPSHVIDRIDITSGPNAAVNGVNMSNNGTDSGATAAPGTLNIVTKAAPLEEVNRFTSTFSGRSNFGAYFDVARRFGGNKSWGVRVNAEVLNGGLALDGAENNSNNIFLNLDHQSGSSSSNLFGGYFDLRIDGGQRWFTFGGSGSELPTAPDASTDYDFLGTTKQMHGYVVTLNHEQRLSDDWAVFANYGSMEKSGYKYNSSSALRFDNAGGFTTANVSNAQVESTENYYGQLGIRGKFATGPLRHNVALAADLSIAKYWNVSTNSQPGTIIGGLYDGVDYTSDFIIPARGNPVLQWTETNVGLTLSDVITLGKFDLLLAASMKDENFLNEVTGVRIKNNNILPTYGLTYRITPNLSIYAGHTESFSRGQLVANDTRYVNAGETLSPMKAKQNEVGVKLLAGGMLTTLAVFEMDQQNLIDVVVTDTTFRREADGKNRYRGIELSSVGQLTEQLTLTVGGLYLDAERQRTNRGLQDGRFVNGVSEWSGTAGLEFRPVERVGLVGRAVYNGEAFIDAGTGGGTTRIPGFVSFDLGANFKTGTEAVPIRLSTTITNVGNRSHWMGRGGSTTFGLSMPRTFLVSAQFDF